MDDMTKLLEQLATKLGTTTEYLWGVLIKQAPISALMHTGLFIMALVIGFILFRIHKKLYKRDQYGDTSYDKNEVYMIPMGIMAFAWLMLFIISVLTLNNAFIGFLNPEYWALKEILGTLTE